MRFPRRDGRDAQTFRAPDSFDPDDVVGARCRQPAQHVEPRGGEARDPLRVFVSGCRQLGARRRQAFAARDQDVAELCVARDGDRPVACVDDGREALPHFGERIDGLPIRAGPGEHAAQARRGHRW